MKETFLEYLKKQLKRDDPIGDMARDWGQDQSAEKPKKITRRNELCKYLAKLQACPGAIAAAESAWDEWSAL